MARGAEARVPTVSTRARWRVPQFLARQDLVTTGGWWAPVALPMVTANRIFAP